MKNKKHVMMQPGSPKLSEVIGQFLASKATQSRTAYLLTLRSTLGRLTHELGDPPVNAVTTGQLSQAIFASGATPRSRRQKLALIKTFFTWSRANGHLPPHLPTVADPIRIVVPAIEPAILTPAELKTLLAGTQDVEVRLRIALSAFAGLRSDELERVDWSSVDPAATIRVEPELSLTRAWRVVPILPVLHAWLQPFYCSQGPVLRARDSKSRLRQWARRLGVPLKSNVFRHSCGACRYALTVDLVRTGAEMGLDATLLARSFLTRITREQALEYFSLTPEAVGIKDWPQRVAKYLKRRQALPPTARTR
jgi:integrase